VSDLQYNYTKLLGTGRPFYRVSQHGDNHVSFTTQETCIRRESESMLQLKPWNAGAGFLCDKTLHCNSQMTACVQYFNFYYNLVQINYFLNRLTHQPNGPHQKQQNNYK
jgi:hypothetical protein